MIFLTLFLEMRTLYWNSEILLWDKKLNDDTQNQSAWLKTLDIGFKPFG